MRLINGCRAGGATNALLRAGHFGIRQLLGSAVVLLASGAIALGGPLTLNGDAFALVANRPGTQLFGLTSDAQGRIYIGNNSNNTTGISVQMFDPSLYSGSPIALQNFGPAVGDGDGLTFGNGSIYVGDQNEGLRKIAVPGGSSSVLAAGRSINPTGSPIVYRPSDGHLFIGYGATAGSALGDNRIDELDSLGNLVQTFETVAETETMTFDAASGLIYYSNFDFFGPSSVRAFDPVSGTDTFIGFSSGSIDGGLTYDPLSNLLFVGAANGLNPGYVETMNPLTGATTPFAFGFNGSLGILREGLSGDLYFLESNNLYRLESENVFPVPEPSTLALASFGGMALAGVTRRRRRAANAISG